MASSEPRQFQHFTQAKYLQQWSEPSGRLNVFSKATGKPFPRRSHKNSCGDHNWQSAELEKAYHYIESKVGEILEHRSEATPEEARLLTSWLALHHIRTPRNKDALAKGYDQEIAKFHRWLTACGGFYQLFDTKCLMTSDSPICVVSANDEFGPLEFVIAPLSPSKTIYITPNDALPSLKGSNAPLFGAEKINQVIAHCAHNEIVSYDRQLHLP